MSDEVTCHDCGLEYYGPAGHKCLGFNISDMLERIEALEAAPRLALKHVARVDLTGMGGVTSRIIGAFDTVEEARDTVSSLRAKPPAGFDALIGSSIDVELCVVAGDVVQIVKLGDVVEETLH